MSKASGRRENLQFDQKTKPLDMAQKFYVVWAGRQTGVFTDWPTVQKSVEKFAGARFKSFSTRAEADLAFRQGSDSADMPGGQKGPGASDAPRGSHVAHRFDVSIYCDGACDPNPGHAGSGIVVYRAGELAELWYGLYNPHGTNNTAELNALFRALSMAEVEIAAGRSVEVCSDSAYSINCVRKWAPGWEKRGWTRVDGPIKNLQIIQDCYAIYRRIKKQLRLIHVAGHAGTEGNELADRMAMLAVQSREKELRLVRDEIDIPKLLKMRTG